MLSKKEKKTYRSLLFRHIDGISLIGPISQLYKSSMVDFIIENDSFSIDDLNKIKKSNIGYLNITLHLLRCQGWLELNNDIFCKTKNGEKALNLFHLYSDIYKHIDKLIDCNNSLFQLNSDNDYINDILTVIKKQFENKEIDSTYNQIFHHLIGFIIGPILVSIGMSKHYNEILASGKLSNIKNYCNKNTYNQLNELFIYLQWTENEEFTYQGEFYLKRASAYGVTTSYLPAYSLMETILFGNVNPLWKKINNKEQHVNRVMNVWGSGGAHTTYFKKIDEIIIDIFNQPIEEQPLGIADMGCGDGTLLIHLYDVVKNKTLRGKKLNEYPLYIIGADFNLEAQETSQKNLSNANIECIILEADISSPNKFNKLLNDKYNIKLNELLNVRSFLDHNRVFKNPLNNDINIPTCTGAYAHRGELIKNATLEQNLLEHLQAWRPHVDKHGLLLLELHCLDPKIITKNIGLTGSTAYESTHGYSDQYIVNIECFIKLAIESGLTPAEKYQLKFPDNELGNISINLFK